MELGERIMEYQGKKLNATWKLLNYSGYNGESNGT